MQALNGSVCLHLATRPGLKTLSIPHVILPNTLPTRMKYSYRSQFPSMEHLTCMMDNSTFETLAPKLWNLKTLDLQFADDLDSGVAAVSHCIHLTSLSIKMQCRRPTATSKALLIIAKQCTELRTFSIVTNIDGARLKNEANSSFTQLEELTKSLPNLVDFKYALDNSFSVWSLITLGKHCPNLTSFSACGFIELKYLGANGPQLLPKLENLEMSGQGSVNGSSVDKVAEDLAYHAPNLIRFYNSADTKWSDDVREKVEKRRAVKEIRIRTGEPPHIERGAPGVKMMEECRGLHAQADWKDVNPAFTG